jgi:hypothetical protein
MKASLTFKTIYLDAYIVDVLVGEIKIVRICPFRNASHVVCWRFLCEQR